LTPPVMTSYPLRIPGRQIVLRDFRREDVDAALAVVGDDQVTRWLSFDTRNRAQTSTMIGGAIERAQSDPRTEFYLAVTLPNDTLIGFARLGLDGVQAGKLGYAIRADQWGRGYATDAARTLTNYGFQQLDLHRISAAIGPDNGPSVALVRRLGFQYEGRIRDHVYTNGAWRDSLLYSVLDQEWAKAIAADDSQRASAQA
jgi:[ribosomal protein S5]-alanine N-acetyltransferase